MEKTGMRAPLNSPIPHQDPLDSAPGPAPTTKGILQNLPATPSPGNPQAVHPKPDTEADEGNPVRIEHLEAGVAAPGSKTSQR